MKSASSSESIVELFGSFFDELNQTETAANQNDDQENIVKETAANYKDNQANIVEETAANQKDNQENFVEEPASNVFFVESAASAIKNKLHSVISTKRVSNSNPKAEPNNDFSCLNKDVTLLVSPCEIGLVPIPFPSSAKSDKSTGISHLLNSNYLLETVSAKIDQPPPQDEMTEKEVLCAKDIDVKNDALIFDTIENEAVFSSMLSIPDDSALILDLNMPSLKINWQLHSSEVFIKQEDLPKISESFGIGLEKLPEQRLARVFKQENKSIAYTSKTSSNNLFNLMIVGKSGLGKSTFINTLFQSEILKTALNETNAWFEDNSKKRIFTDFKNPLEKECESTTKINKTYVALEEQKVNLKLCIVDTPGFGDYSDNSFSWVPICQYIDSQFTQFMFNEEQPYRNLKIDSRIHCCLYFLSPSNKGLSPLDIIAMQEISKRVNLIPVIAKSDGLTADEIKNFKCQIREIISKQNIKICDLLLKAQKRLKENYEFPFAIVGGNYNVGKKRFGRQYPHGFVDVMDSAYSDFTKLRDFIIRDNMVDLINSTNSYYEIWRHKLLTFRFNKIAELIAASEKENEFSENKQETASITDQELIKNIGETSKTFAELNLEADAFDKNGLDNYKVYAVINKQSLEKHILDWDPIFIHKQWVLQNSFNELVDAQEQKFKERKKMLLDKQNQFNDEIDLLHSKVKKLQKQCLGLEKTVKENQKTGKKGVRIDSGTLFFKH